MTALLRKLSRSIDLDCGCVFHCCQLHLARSNVVIRSHLTNETQSAVCMQNALSDDGHLAEVRPPLPPLGTAGTVPSQCVGLDNAASGRDESSIMKTARRDGIIHPLTLQYQDCESVQARSNDTEYDLLPDWRRHSDIIMIRVQRTCELES
ncbi:hypothetical protein F2P81_005554 [Scophthalmus maximus]|uniref:Uncharacterized protein n=1 Tax=Scophthalmus maximus TaxID=52904 RepID=A0A6A4TIZ6_SCOMX|nr:hypothetical protein F2P81_005554 [Scophthalmus maximus]